MVPLIHITADEVNHIIYSYLQDSGFFHTAFALRAEGRLEQSPHFNEYVPRGELVELLTKALLYIEVETHCKGDGLITDCQTPFSLLKRHECAADVIEEVIVNGALEKATGKEAITNGIADTPMKRKANIPAEGDSQERRVKRLVDVDAGESASAAGRESNPSKDVQEVSPSERDRSPMSVTQTSQMVNGDFSRRSKSGRPTPGPGDDTAPSKAVMELKGHTSEVFVCAWNPAKPSLLASGSKDATARIWNLPDPPEDPAEFAQPPKVPPIELKHLPDSEQRDITSLDWNRDGDLLATGSYDSILRVWTVTGDEYMTHPQHQGPIFATRFSQSGQWLLSASLDGTACVWDVKEKKLYMQFRCHADCCLDVEWLDDTTFASCGADKLVHIMRLGNQDPLRTLEGHTNEVNQIKFNTSRTRIASASDDQTARIWTIGNLGKSKSSDEIPGLGVTAPEMVECLVLEGHADSIGNLAWCPITPTGSNELLATASFDGSARLWDATTGVCLRAISDHKRAIYTLKFSHDGIHFVSGSGDGWLYVYESNTGRQVYAWYAGAERPGIYELDWQQTGKLNRIAMCLENRSVGIVDVSRVPALMHTPSKPS